MPQEAKASEQVNQLPRDQNSRRITDIASNFSPSCLHPLSFFVSWQGVLTLAYKYVLKSAAKHSLNLVINHAHSSNNNTYRAV